MEPYLTNIINVKVWMSGDTINILSYRNGETDLVRLLQFSFKRSYLLDSILVRGLCKIFLFIGP